MVAKRLFAIVIATLPLLIGCSSDGTPAVEPHAEQEVTTTTTLEPAPAIPQTSKKSPLAQLMRTITAHADSVRAALKRNAELPPYPTAVNDMLTATPTDSLLDRNTLAIFSGDYKGKLNALYKAPVEERTKAYNGLVQSCATCHSTMCPGPLVLIRKMYAPPAAKAP